MWKELKTRNMKIILVIKKDKIIYKNTKVGMRKKALSGLIGQGFDRRNIWLAKEMG